MFTDPRIFDGGATEMRDGSICMVPKLNLISRLQALLHEGRLKILRSLPEAEALIRELQDFRAQYTDAGHMTFTARSGRHDDLVLALAIAAWYAHRGGGAFFEAMRLRAGVSAPRYFVGLDLGQARDPSAIAIVRRVDEPAPEDLVAMPVARNEPTYAVGSLEWQRQQERLQKGADRLPPQA